MHRRRLERFFEAPYCLSGRIDESRQFGRCLPLHALGDEKYAKLQFIRIITQQLCEAVGRLFAAQRRVPMLAPADAMDVVRQIVYACLQARR
ncbi:MAG: hypothetical protein R8K46_01820 [Mariprofundaceae bacterium]